jgi:hypothetical protein
MSYRPSIIRSIQRGTIAISSGASSNTATITAVTTANTMLLYNGNSSDDASGDNPSRAQARITLTNSTTITATRGATTNNIPAVNYSAVEFFPGIVNSIQRGTITIADGDTDQAATITSVNTAKAEVFFLGQSSDIATETAAIRQVRVRLSSATEVIAERTGTVTGAVTVSYQVVEFK